MGFIALLKAEGMRITQRRLIVMLIISGICSAGVLASVNKAAAEIAKGKTALLPFTIFIILVLTNIISTRYVTRVTTREVEQVVHRLRIRLISKLRNAQLHRLEKLGTGVIYAAIGKDTQTLSQLSSVLTSAIQAMVMIFFGAVYLAFLSPMALAAAAAFVVATSAVYSMKSRAMNSLLMESSRLENRLYDRLNDFIDGFKETRMHRARSDELHRHFQEDSKTAAQARIVALTEVGSIMIFTQTALFLLVGTMVFVVPILSPKFASSVVQTSTAVLFLFGSLSSVVGAIPAMASADMAARNLHDIEAALNESSVEELLPDPDNNPAFESLELSRIVYSHHDAGGRTLFTLGPLSFKLNRGEMLFITGGNGAGKTTFIKVLTGLYDPNAGSVSVNGTQINAEERQLYRELFAVVFNDPHLFARLYGLGQEAFDRAPALLAKLELTGKLSIKDGVFSTIDLSTGQRKRLALLVALLEDKPILILDEWAADQDPIFRKKFYRELLPEIKASGKTIVAITHDDAYFDVADRRMKLDYGNISEE